MRIRVPRTAFVVLLAIVSTVAVPAQQSTANIVGSVIDPSGAAAAGAAVKAINELTGETHNATSNAMGDYLIPGVAVGRYRIEVEVSGFKKYIREGVTLNVAQNARMDARLELGQVTQEVVVQGGVPLVDTREAQLGGLVDEKRIIDLPLNGRSVYSLVSILPGIANAQLPQQTDLSQGARFNVNGARALQTLFLLDGGLNVGVNRNGGLLVPNPDAVQEFRLITSNYNAEYGRSAGGTVTVVTKSGTNRLHGSLFEFLRNDALDARGFFQASVSPLKRNMFGGTVSGPVIHDKLFYFFSYQGDRQRLGQFANAARTPSAAQRRGDFSTAAANQRPLDPNGGQPFPGGVIPASRLDPVAQNILKLIALPNTPDGRVEATRGATLDTTQYFGKADYQASSNHKASAGLFFVRSNNYYPFTNASGTNSNIPDYAPVSDTPNQNNVTVNEIWTARPTLLNQFTFSYAYGLAAPTSLNRLCWPDWGSKFVPGQVPCYPPQFTVSAGWKGGPGGENVEEDSIYSAADSVTWIRGAHSLKAGGSLQFLRMDYWDRWRLGGNIGVSGAFTKNSFADFELGRADSMLVSNGNVMHLRSKAWAGFAQDDWKISRRVTLNLGLRYEIFLPYTALKDRLGNFRPGQQSTVFPNAPTGLVFPGDQGVPKGLVATDRNNFAPRVGIAVDPFGDGKTAIRAGYGVFYSVAYSNLTQFNSNAQPFAINVTAYGTPSFVDPFANAGGNPFPIPAGVNRFVLSISPPWLDQNARTPYVQQYNFTVQRQLWRDMSLEVAYVGNVSRKLYWCRDANQPVYIPGKSTAANVDGRRPISPGVFGLIGHAETASNASYNSLQTTLRRQFSRGLTLLGNYAFAKAIDIQSADQQNWMTLALVDSSNPGLDRGVSGNSLRHVFNLSFVWEPARIQRWGFLGKKILSDWQVNAIARYASGPPFSVTSGVDTNLDGQNNDRPNLVGNPYLDSGRPKNQLLARYFNPAAFAAAATGTYGTAGRNIMYGPGMANWDVSLFKNIPIRERHQLQFRAEFFNFINHANFGNPVSQLNNPNVGRILAASAGRIIQFGLKYSF